MVSLIFFYHFANLANYSIDIFLSLFGAIEKYRQKYALYGFG